MKKNVLFYPHITEKSITLIESGNEIVFIVKREADKKCIKNAFEKTFNVKVSRISTAIDRKGRKKAFIKMKGKEKALDIATNLGLI